MEKRYVEMELKGIALDGKDKSPLVLLKDKTGNKVLPIWIGPFEASAIIVEIEDVKPPRPMTHELLYLFLERHGFCLKNVEIYGRQDSRYLSRIIYKKGLKNFSLEARPSDCIALALKGKAPIFCSKEILLKENVAENLLENLNNFNSEILFFGMENADSPIM